MKELTFIDTYRKCTKIHLYVILETYIKESGLSEQAAREKILRLIKHVKAKAKAKAVTLDEGTQVALKKR